MSTDYFVTCYTCEVQMDGSLASGSAFYGFKTWDEGIAEFRAWLPAHEGHDVRIVSEHVDLPWECDCCGLPLVGGECQLGGPEETP